MTSQDWLILGVYLCTIGTVLMFGGLPFQSFILTSVGIGGFGAGFIAYVLGLRMKGGSSVLFRDRSD